MARRIFLSVTDVERSFQPQPELERQVPGQCGHAAAVALQIHDFVEVFAELARELECDRGVVHHFGPRAVR